MYLKRLEIYGFKSFGTKSTLDFENQNIAAVVGPNGSGKSNVADAIRWVLGEQSTNLLRGKKGEDVIFAGSQKRSRSSYAEVSLLLYSDKDLEVEIANKKMTFREIEISRKIYRSGENEYYVNRKKVRLLDLQQLLATLGFGQSSYTVIGQGMVDRLLFFNAAERRVLFDEAAGVKQYKIKRGQAIKKLETTEENLIRLRDINRELEPQVQNLKRLVKKAEGREKVEEELSETESTYYGSIIYELEQSLSKYRNEKKTFIRKIDAKKQEIKGLDLARQDQALTKFTNSRAERNRELDKLLAERDETIREISFLEGQAKEQENYLIALKGNRQSLVAEEKNLNQSLAVLKSKIDKVNEDIDRRRSEKEKCEAEKAEEMAENRGLEKLEAEIAELSRQRRDLEGQIYQIKEKAKWHENQKETVEKEKQTIAREVSEHKQELKEKTKQLEELNYAKEKFETEVKTLEKKLEQAVKSFATVQKELISAKNDVSQEKVSEFKQELETLIKDHDVVRSALENEKDINKFKTIFTGFSEKLNRIFKTTRRISEALDAETRSVLEEKLAGFRQEQGDLQEKLNVKVREISVIGQKTGILEHQLKHLGEVISEKTKRGETIQFSGTGDFPKELKAVGQKLDLTNKELAAKKDSFEKEKELAEKKLREFREKKAKKAENVYQINLDITRLESDLHHYQNEYASLEQKLSQTREMVAKSEKTEIDDSLDKKIVQCKEKLKEIDEAAAKLKQEIEAESDKERELENKALAHERALNLLEREIAELAAEMNEVDLSIAKAETRSETVRDEMRAFGVQDVSATRMIDQEVKDVLRARIENLRRKKDSIASVDPETLAEYQESEKRLGEMSAQIVDLEKAKDDLGDLIKELDRKISAQFTGTFKSIADKFQDYFSLLFGGGKAELVLGQDESGEMGIEISANPPGKKVQSLGMLSGGERTLTSLALVFAILSINPSPFCVLDEVDAALDESNTLRFVKILESLDRKTQFIVITHNRETMRVADLLYGLSMNEEHVSKLFSIRLAEALREAK